MPVWEDNGFREKEAVLVIRLARFAVLLAVVAVGVFCLPLFPAAALPLLQNGPQQQGSGFLGAWCAQGDPGKHATISSNGVFFTLTNELGDTSPGTLQGPNQIQAPGWQFVTGSLSNDGSRIAWSNGTFWARCHNGGGGATLTGTWFANGDRSRTCSIRQRFGGLTLQNENGDSANGTFQGRHSIVTNWGGTTIHGQISRDGNRINWDNGTYWVRSRLY